MRKREVGWNLLDWDYIKTYIRKFQKKIHSAALLKEYARVKFLQNKFIKSKLFIIWAIYLGEKYHSIRFNKKYNLIIQLQTFNYLNIKQAFLPGNQVKIQLLLFHLVLLPEWNRQLKTKYNSQYNQTSNSINKSIHTLKTISLKKDFLYLIEFKVIKCINEISLLNLINKLNCSSYIKISFEKLIKSGFLSRYKKFIKNKYFCLEDTLNIEIQLGNLLMDIIIYQLNNILCASLKNIQTLFYNKDPYSFLRTSTSIIFFHSNYLTIEKIQENAIDWFKYLNSSIIIQEMPIQLMDKKYLLTHHIFLKKIQDNNTLSVITKPSLFAQKHLLHLISRLMYQMKNSEIDNFLYQINLLLTHWKKYFNECNCLKTFSCLDAQIFQKIRAWVFRKHPKWSKMKIKQKYFLIINGYRYGENIYSGNWLLSFKSTDKNPLILNKLRWKNNRSSIPSKEIFLNDINHYNYLYQYSITLL
uniref:putative reverse transcriptase/maturase n=1 Tax=Goniotrichopsis reniformis TaxID=468933 RepID=UPI001FCD2212|nr:putative reverse transcriptase/maturase [Goniotrichopsis reniformis]UNJ14867.1 putative reverse transcriptase/maturase [Goniotrichopsis reniformis]